MNNPRLSAILGLMFIGIISRFLPHPPNFNSINAIALFGAFYFNSRLLSAAVVVATLFLSDLFLGLHSTMLFVYLSFMPAVFLGHKFNGELSFPRTPLVCMLASLLSCLVVNLGVWMFSGLYEQTMSGLILCYIAAIPFFINRLLGDLTYGLLLGGCACLIKRYNSTAVSIR